tara:strand:- start:25 stop:426 length:402 start_codon:yes stop_codon:yes gene_type:complete
LIERPVINDDLIILSDRRMVKILFNVFLIKEDEIPVYIKKINMWRRHAKINGSCKGTMRPEYEPDKEKGIQTGRTCDDFYNNLNERPVLYSDGFQRQNVVVDYNTDKKKKKKEKKKRAPPPAPVPAEDAAGKS